MNGSNLNIDYYDILGADERTSPGDIERLYKRMAARRHPDKGGSDEEMKILNEAYAVLKDERKRQQYDTERRKPGQQTFTVTSGPPPRDVGIFGQGLSAFLCLLVGLFLLFLVRFQWIWFLWPLAILAVFVILFGIIMARGVMVALNASLPATNRLRSHTILQEAVFWMVVGGGGYGIYLIFTALE